MTNPEKRAIDFLRNQYYRRINVLCRRILIVEDETEVREEFTELLELRGWQVEGARDVASAISALRNAQEPAVLLTDLRLTDGSGLDLARAVSGDPALRARVARMIMMTGHTDLTEQVDRTLAEQGVRMLFKPVDVAALLTLLAAERPE